MLGVQCRRVLRIPHRGAMREGDSLNPSWRRWSLPGDRSMAYIWFVPVDIHPGLLGGGGAEAGVDGADGADSGGRRGGLAAAGGGVEDEGEGFAHGGHGGGEGAHGCGSLGEGAVARGYDVVIWLGGLHDEC